MNERHRKSAVRRTERTDRIDCQQQITASSTMPICSMVNSTNLPSMATQPMKNSINCLPMPIQSICTVVNSINMPISSVPVLLHPSNSIQSLCTPQLEKTIRFGEFEENLKEFVNELREAECEFLEEVGKINTMDRLIFENASYLECLHLHLQDQITTGKIVDTDVKKLFTQLNCLEETVQNLERHFDGEKNQHQDWIHGVQKENLYNFLIHLDTNLNYLVNQLSEAICLNNSANGSCHNTGPIHQIRCILNHNFETLLQLENAILESKVQMERLASLQKEIQNRSRYTKNCT